MRLFRTPGYKVVVVYSPRAMEDSVVWMNHSKHTEPSIGVSTFSVFHIKYELYINK